MGDPLHGDHVEGEADGARRAGTTGSVAAGRIAGNSIGGASSAVGRRDRPDQRHAGGESRRGNATRRAGQARRLADDAYWGEFETSDMETAVRKYLGFARAGELERQFWRSARRPATWPNAAPLSVMADLSHELLLDLLAASRELDAKGVTDRSRRSTRTIRRGSGRSAVAGRAARSSPACRRSRAVLLQALRRGFHEVGEKAEHDGPDEAASELTTYT